MLPKWPNSPPKSANMVPKGGQNPSFGGSKSIQNRSPRGLEMNMLKVYDFAHQILLLDRQHGPKRGPKSTFWGSKVDQKSIKMSPGRGLERDTPKKSNFDPKFSPQERQHGPKRGPKSVFLGCKTDQKSIKMSPGRGLGRDTEK